MRWEQRGNPSSHWTIALAERWFYLSLFVIAGLHLVLAAVLPFAEDELYYWVWSKDLRPGYFDHPPMVAYLIRLSSSIFGDGALGIRFFACLLSLFTLLMMTRFTPRKQLLGLIILTPIYLYGSVLMTPDIPLLFFWTAYAWWATHFNRRLSEWSDDPIARVYRRSPVTLLWWIGGGILLGLGALSKYTMLLAIPCSLLMLIIHYRFRAWALGYLLHLVVALVVFSPTLAFNLNHHFASFHFQWNHAMSGSGLTFQWFFDFLGSQILLIGGLPLLMLPWVLFNSGDLSRDPRLGASYYFYVLPILFFLFQALRSRLEGNWALVAYVTFWPLAQRLLDFSSFKGIGRMLVSLGFFVPIGASLVFLVHMVHPLKYIEVHQDRLNKLRTQFSLMQQVAQDVKAQNGQLKFFAPSYQWTSFAKYSGMDARQLPDFGRPSQFTLVPEKACENKEIFAFEEVKNVPSVYNCFAHRRVVKEYPWVVRGVELNRYALTLYSN